MEEFCDQVMRENAGRAIKDKEPLSFRQQKERWRDCVEGYKGNHYNAQQKKPEEQKFKQDSQRQNFQGGGGNQSGGSSQNSSGAGARSGFDPNRGRGVRYNGSPVCFHYNNRSGCSRALKDKSKPEEGCDDGRGGAYAHVCNFEMGGGKNC